jgi:hypothetical protein
MLGGQSTMWIRGPTVGPPFWTYPEFRILLVLADLRLTHPDRQRSPCPDHPILANRIYPDKAVGITHRAGTRVAVGTRLNSESRGNNMR